MRAGVVFLCFFLPMAHSPLPCLCTMLHSAPHIPAAMSTATAAAAHGVVDGASVPLAKGWGSFQSPSVELLIHQSDDEYRAPPLPPFATDFTIPTHLLPPAPSAADGTDSAGAAADADAVVQPFGRATCLQSLFLLDPVWTFVNHGAFGATLRPMLHVRNQWSEWMVSRNRCCECMQTIRALAIALMLRRRLT